MTEKERIYSELLVLRCRRKDRGAFEELIRLWETKLFFYIRRLVSDEEDAWDILQKTWVKVLQGIGSLKNPGSLASWLYSIARHTVMDHFIDRYSEVQAEEMDEETLAEIQDDNSPDFDDAERVHRGLDLISLAHREALTLFFLEDFSIDEIASILNVSPGTVKSRLHYAKRALRLVLEKEE
ncbi:MAG: sigma-70 family RNA polymerase sigma factor [Candidatus Latescibacter sp.]|nr:sigma-70 family RNA polymerase sigma factor [Candidatus Latescibacter sp.]